MEESVLTEFDQLSKQIYEDTEMGVMCYFGGKSGQKSELEYKRQLVEHSIRALLTLQHNGNLVLQLNETYSAFTVGLIYVLY